MSLREREHRAAVSQEFQVSFREECRNSRSLIARAQSVILVSVRVALPRPLVGSSGSLPHSDRTIGRPTRQTETEFARTVAAAAVEE
jgi:hypothetical protein